MTAHAHDVPRLRERAVVHGERWVYVAGCNVPPGAADLGRVDRESDDLRWLLDQGARVAVLTHQGSATDGSAVHVPHVAARLSTLLGRPVGYHPAASGPSARERAAALRPGEAVVLGNVRTDPREQQDDDGLAVEYAQLGDAVAVGGFSRAHRRDASNHALLRHRPSYATRALLDEVAALAPWAERPGATAAVVGGVKREKTAVALRGFAATHALVLPGGAVLNALLGAAGHAVGSSSLGEDPPAALAAAHDVLARRSASLVLPTRVVTREVGGTAVALRDVADGVPAGWAIVDHVVPAAARAALSALARAGGRVLLAGTPGVVGAGHTRAASTYAAALAEFGDRAVLLGGDTVQEVPFAGPRSTGGGAALRYLVDGRLAVLDALAGARRTAVAS